MRYHERMGSTSRREMMGLTTTAILAPLDAFAQSPDKIPAEIEAKIPSVEMIDTIVRNYVRESKGGSFDTNALATRTAAPCTSCSSYWVDLLVGFTSMATSAAVGTNSCSSSCRFELSRVPIMCTPVRLASGRLRLVTSPVSTGS